MEEKGRAGRREEMEEVDAVGRKKEWRSVRGSDRNDMMQVFQG